jgi:hypothetical protein
MRQTPVDRAAAKPAWAAALHRTCAAALFSLQACQHESPHGKPQAPKNLLRNSTTFKGPRQAAGPQNTSPCVPFISQMRCDEVTRLTLLLLVLILLLGLLLGLLLLLLCLGLLSQLLCIRRLHTQGAMGRKQKLLFRDEPGSGAQQAGNNKHALALPICYCALG